MGHLFSVKPYLETDSRKYFAICVSTTEIHDVIDKAINSYTFVKYFRFFNTIVIILMYPTVV